MANLVKMKAKLKLASENYRYQNKGFPDIKARKIDLDKSLSKFEDYSSSLTSIDMNIRRRKGSIQGEYFPAEDKVIFWKLALSHGPLFADYVVGHELIHSTGHPDRLNRDSIRDFVLTNKTSVDRLATEELVATMGSAIMNYDAYEQDSATMNQIELSMAYYGWANYGLNGSSFDECWNQTLEAVEYLGVTL
jgi:antirestriction protein ArdC